MAQLRIRGTAGAFVGGERALTDLLLIGRSPDADLRLDHPSIAAQHAVISRVGDNVIVAALAPMAGLSVNGRETRRCFLQPGDRVRLGAVELQLLGGEARRGVEDFDDDEHTEEFAVAEAELVKRVDLSRPPVAHPRASELLHRLTHLLSRDLSQEELVGAVLDLGLTGLRADTVAIGLLDEQGSVVDAGYRLRPGGPSVDGSQRLSRSFCAHLIQRRVGLIVRDVWVDERFGAADSLLAAAVRAVLGVPMIVGGEVYGVLVATCHTPAAAFDEADLDLLTLLGAHLALWLRAMGHQRKQAAIIEQLERTQTHLITLQNSLVRAEQMAAAGRVAARAAHEVRNLIAPLGIVRLLTERHPDDEEVAEITSLIEESRERILTVIRELHDTTRQPALELSPSVQSLRGVMERAIAFARHDDVFDAVTLRVAEGVADVGVLGDAGLLHQVVLNLLRNGAQATGPGGLVTLRLEREASLARVVVEDDGPGVPAELHDRIFEPFFSTKGEDGLGLGLDIARQIMQRHGGDLILEEKAPPGARFVMILPSLPALQEPPPPAFDGARAPNAHRIR